MNQPRLRDGLHAFGSWYLLKSGSNFSCRLRLLSWLGLVSLKYFGATSVSHFGSMAHTSRMYSFVVCTSSW